MSFFDSGRPVFGRVSLWVACGLLSVVLFSSDGNLSADEPTSRHTDGLHEAPPNSFAFTHARIFVDPQTVLEDATLVISAGQIVAVGTQIEIPPGTQVIDATGRTLLPAPIDAYAPAPVAADPADNATYWNDQIHPERRTLVGLRPDASQDQSLRAQGFAVRLFAPEEGILRGGSALLLLDDAPVDRRVLAAEPTLNALLTLNARGGRDTYPGSPMGAVAVARQAFYDAQWYAAAQRIAKSDPATALPEFNRSLAALGPVLDRQIPLMVETSSEAFVLRADRFAREFDVLMIVVGNGREYRRVAEIAATERDLVLPIDFPAPPDVASAERANQASLESMMHWDLAPENPARLHAAGIRFALTTHGLNDLKEFWPNLRKAIERGLPSEVALAALTTTPAEMFGVADRVGTLEKGKLANFIVCDASPFEKEAKIFETWVMGQKFEINDAPESRLAGRWSLNFSGVLPEATIEFSGNDSDLKGSWLVPAEADGEGEATDPAASNDVIEGSEGAAAEDETEAEASKPEPLKFKQLGVQEWRIAALVPGEALEQTGVLQLTLTLNPAAPETASGFLIDTQGRRYEITSQRLPSEPVSEEASDNSEPSDASATDTSATDEPTADTAAAGSEETVETPETPAETPESTQETSELVAAERALFEVNYPLGAYGRSAPPIAPTALFFQNATVWTSGPAGILENCHLLVVDGLIAAVGPDLVAPDGATIIDATGMHLTPGIIDCHSHMATDGGVNESGQAITAEVRIGDFVDADDITIYRQLAGGVTAANILHGSANPIGGQNQVIKLRWGATGEAMKFAEAPAGIKFALGENVKQANWGDNFTTRYPQTRMGVQQIMQDSFLAARKYRDDHLEWNNERRGLPVRRDLELDAIVEILEGKRWIHCHSYRQDEILALLKTLDEFQITIGSLQHVLEGYKVADAIRRHGGTASAFSDWWAYKVEVSDAIPYAGALMHEAGVVVSFNSDDGEMARHLNQEAAKAVKYGGVDPAEALKFVTLNPAIQLRIDQYVGSIEPGKHADLVFWSGSPLSNFSRCEQTWIDGKKYFDRAEDLAQRAQVDTMRAALIQRILTSGEKPEQGPPRRPDPSSLWPRHDEFCAAHDHALCLQRQAREQSQ